MSIFLSIAAIVSVAAGLLVAYVYGRILERQRGDEYKALWMQALADMNELADENFALREQRANRVHSGQN